MTGKIRKYFNNQRLQVKIFTVVIILSLLLVLSHTYIWSLVCKAYNNYIYNKNAQICIAYTEQMETRFEKLNTLTLSIIGDTNIQNDLFAYTQTETLSGEGIELRKKIEKQVKTYLYDNDFLKFGIYTLDMKVIGTGLNLPQDSIAQLMERAINKKGRMEIIVQDQRIFMVRQIRRISDLATLGVMIGEFDLAGILQENGEQYQKSGIALNVSIFAEGQYIYCDDTTVSILEKDGWAIRNGYFVTQNTTEDGWIYLLYTPYQKVLETIRLTMRNSIILMVLITVCMMLICRRILQKILMNLEQLVVEFGAYGKGILPVYEVMDKDETQKDEIHYLHQQFVKMAYAHKKLEEENYNRMLLNKEAQYKQLQRQIQPHFIFNTLSLISWMAYQHEDPEIVELTSSLSRLIRGSMTFNENRITIEKEIEFVESYVCIQKYRYGDRIDFSIEIPKEMYQVELPQMTLQPLVENAITYGLEEMLDTCIIRIQGRIEGDKAVCIVEDNGEGIDEDILEKLSSGEKQAQGNGIGLVNVHKRIQMAFSEEYGLSFRRKADVTQVCVTLPAVWKKEGDGNV